MCHVTDFRADDLMRLNLQPHQQWMRASLADGYGVRLESAGPARTVWDEDTPIACFGESIHWPGNGELWSLLAGDLGTRFLAVHHAARQFIAQSGSNRLQAYVDATFAPGVRWMLDLGFKVEGKLAGYLPNGNDAFLFASVRRAHDTPELLQMVASFDDPSMLEKILRLESEMAKCEQIDIEPVHHFAHGIYAREIAIPKGTLLTGKMHRTQHLNIISKGGISVLTNDGIERIRAPYAMVSRPGMKRVGYAHEDTVWTTIHGTHETDLARLEDELIVRIGTALEVHS